MLPLGVMAAESKLEANVQRLWNQRNASVYRVSAMAAFTTSVERFMRGAEHLCNCVGSAK